MILKILEVGPLMVNCYIVADEESKEAAVFDPAGNVDMILKALEEDNLKVKYIVNTHAHWDHVGGNQQLQDATGAPIMAHQDEAASLPGVNERAAVYGSSAPGSEASQFLKEGDSFSVGSIIFEVLDLRGHSVASIGFVFEGELELNNGRQRLKLVICGDALFAGSIGRTDFPGGNLPLLLDNIRKKIFTLPDSTIVLPGHGPASTVGREKQFNPFF
ncbi:MAG TPA: MBL fold metallo-hydrolase [Desulfobacteraceae bacterium]|nr:MBL fold metallo-hydrolase [Desulfobacteraceae bacterium]HPJ67138.1 MBL fold metallo-hydrolase [Desulfobacteraceae bacterium]HPQ29344.1 MBL fold metallo-hydrolase [Desulfobacteraceae bacterium]